MCLTSTECDDTFDEEFGGGLGIPDPVYLTVLSQAL